MPPVVGPVMTRAVAAKGVVSCNLCLGQEFRRAEMRREVNEAKPRSAPLDVTQHSVQALLRDRPRAKRALEDLLRCNEALAFGDGCLAHSCVERGDGLYPSPGERRLTWCS